MSCTLRWNYKRCWLYLNSKSPVQDELEETVVTTAKVLESEVLHLWERLLHFSVLMLFCYVFVMIVFQMELVEIIFPILHLKSGSLTIRCMHKHAERSQHQAQSLKKAEVQAEKLQVSLKAAEDKGWEEADLRKISIALSNAGDQVQTIKGNKRALIRISSDPSSQRGRNSYTRPIRP